MRLIDADMEVTAQLFDDMHEEYREEKMPISAFLDLYTNEGCPTAEPKQGEWIPIMWHEITDEEREEEDYPEDWTVFIDSEMPADGEQILVTTKRGEVERDTCLEDNGFYLDSGWDWIDDIVAWMPLPPVYEGD